MRGECTAFSVVSICKAHWQKDGWQQAFANLIHQELGILNPPEIGQKKRQHSPILLDLPDEFGGCFLRLL